MAEQKKPADNRSPQQPPSFEWRNIFIFLAIALVISSWLNLVSAPPSEKIPYTVFKEEVRRGNVAEVTMKGDTISGTFKNQIALDRLKDGGSSTSETARRFTTVLPPVDDKDLIPLLEQNGVIIKAQSEEVSWWLQLLIGMLPWLLLIWLFFYTSRKMQERMTGGNGGIFGIGKSKARLYSAEDPKVTFNDVAGLDYAKADLKDIIAFLKEPLLFRDIGAQVPKGVLMMGPPGTGKTLLARAAAGEAGVTYFSISGSEFVEMFVGVGAARVRDMFEKAKKAAPSMIFIDEIDAVGRSRGTGLGGGHDEREQTLNQILSQMDGFTPEESVVVIAATNRPDVLDPALLRPGRFDRKVVLQLPDREARGAILKVHAARIRSTSDLDWSGLAARTAGFSGADLKNLINEAALLAGRDGKKEVDREAVEQARDKIVLGAERKLLLTEEQKKTIAYHEAGHALVAWLLPHADPLEKITIIPHGVALGLTEQMPREEQYNLRESYLKERIAVMLGGRASEKLIYGETSSGAENDIKQATKLARKMISRWGMNRNLGAVDFSSEEDHVFLGQEIAHPKKFSDHTSEIIDEEVRRLIEGQGKLSTTLLTKNIDHLESLVNELLEHETLDRGSIEKILKEAKKIQEDELASGEEDA